jgi:hypothetical protein
MYFLDYPVDLYSLVPEPLKINTGLISGKLFIEGNISKNIIYFRFEFSPAFEPAPVLIQINASEKSYRYYCTILADKSVSTPVFHPEFNVGQQIFITTVEPVVLLINETNFSKNT